MQRTKTIIATMTATIALAGCAPAVQTSERPATTPQPEPAVTTSERAPEPIEHTEAESEPSVVGGENVEAYFRAYASYDPREMKAMRDLAADNSPAQTYAKIQYAYVVAQQQSYGGGWTGPQTMRITEDGGIELSTEPVGYEGDVEQSLTYTDFELTDGKLASFSAIPPDGGEPVSIDERIVAGGQRQEIAGNTMRLIGAYHSIQADSIILAVSTDASGDSIEYAWNDTYQTDDGREIASTAQLGEDKPRKGRESPYVVIFDSVDLGGTVFIEVNDDDYNAATLKFDLEPVR